MRLIANVPEPIEGSIVRLMIHGSEQGVLMFGYDKLNDSGGLFDEWYDTVDDAKDAASEAYQVSADSWTMIDDPAENCQQDWIQPVRVKGRELGKPQWGKLERLIDGKWEEFEE